jgi:hypothetical protein
MPNAHLPRKPCQHCGREIVWRKKWERAWDEVRFCSQACKRGRSDADTRLESAILNLLATRATGATICPSEAARHVFPQTWREHMEQTRQAARRLVVAGKVQITQNGRAVDPSTARGAIRVRLIG